MHFFFVHSLDAFTTRVNAFKTHNNERPLSLSLKLSLSLRLRPIHSRNACVCVFVCVCVCVFIRVIAYAANGVHFDICMCGHISSYNFAFGEIFNSEKSATRLRKGSEGGDGCTTSGKFYDKRHSFIHSAAKTGWPTDSIENREYFEWFASPGRRTTR